MTKHTPGPWYWSEDRFHGGYSGLFSEIDDEPVAYPQRENDGDDGAAWFGTDENYYGETALKEADASLIAAAPELLAALEGLMSIANDSRGVSGYHLNGNIAEWDEFEEIGAAVAAINKAKGE